MIEIIEYRREFTNQINKLTHDILVKEYGLEKFSEGILSANQEEYLQEGNKLWVATKDGQVVATTGIVRIDYENAMLKRVYTKSNFRGQGIAQKMLEMCIEYAILNSYKYIHLETYKRLERAINFYKRNGFKKCIKDYLTEYEEEYYTLDLKSI